MYWVSGQPRKTMNKKHEEVTDPFWNSSSFSLMPGVIPTSNLEGSNLWGSEKNSGFWWMFLNKGITFQPFGIRYPVTFWCQSFTYCHQSLYIACYYHISLYSTILTTPSELHFFCLKGPHSFIFLLSFSFFSYLYIPHQPLLLWKWKI